MLHIQNLYAASEGKSILKGLNLKVEAGEIHAVMGPNGAGKSTLANVLAGHPSYTVTEGSITFLEKDLLEMEPEERALQGLFMSFQYPPEISGVTTRQFLHHALNAQKKAKAGRPLSEEVFEQLLQDKMAPLDIKPEFLDRGINDGFSGGEKKRGEILQMALLDPKLAILDETDSGLDIDAMRIVASGVNHFMDQNKGLVVITHYQRLLEYIVPDFVHVIHDGKIITSGDKTLALQLEEKGYDWLTQV